MLLLLGIIVIVVLPSSTLHRPVISTAALPIVVRQNADALLIDVRIQGQPKKTLQRPATEELARTLGRVSKAFSPPKFNRKKKNCGHAQVEPSLLQPCLVDQKGNQLNPSMQALEAWSGAAQLHIGSTALDVLFEPAEVLTLLLPTVPQVGVPITPLIETTVGCGVRQCHWQWERLPAGLAEDNWQAVGSEIEYRPSEDDIGARLRVRVAPPASGSYEDADWRLARVAEAAEPVEKPPRRRVLSRRVNAMPTRCGDSFRVLSYNVLADSYSRHWGNAGSIHTYCPPRLTKPTRRMPRLLHEVLSFSPDVVMLQEVDRSWYEQFWLPAMRARGYGGVHTNKRSLSSSEGLATFVRADSFELVEMEPLALSLDPADVPPSLTPLLATHTSASDAQLPTVAQLLLLREVAGAPTSSESPRHLLVANCHLYFSNPAMHVRVMQTAQLLHHAHQWSAQLPEAVTPALVVAGDLNSDSYDATLRLLTSGLVEANDLDWLHGALNWSPSLDLPTAARDAALRVAAALSVCTEHGERLEASVEGVWAWELRHTEAADAMASVERPTLEGARSIARELHLLREAVQGLLAHTAADGPASDDGDDDTLPLRSLVIEMMRDAANGRSLLDSEPLAAAEVARQLKLPLGVVAGGAEALHATSWYTRAHSRISKLTQRLVTIKCALRARVAAEGHGEAAAADGAEAARWAARAAGVRLSQPTPLTSAYGMHTQPTHVVPRYANTLDWICFDGARLGVVGVAPLPPLEELTRDVAMPSAEWPSDHVSLCCDLEWR